LPDLQRKIEKKSLIFHKISSDSCKLHLNLKKKKNATTLKPIKIFSLTVTDFLHITYNAELFAMRKKLLELKYKFE